jgi:hypothetical protein
MGLLESCLKGGKGRDLVVGRDLIEVGLYERRLLRPPWYLRLSASAPRVLRAAALVPRS